MIENLLKSLGFEAEEIKTYLLLLELGQITAGELAKKMGAPRSSLYGFLKKLSHHGLIIESQKHGIKVFIAEAPEKINLLFNQKIEGLQKSQTQFKELLPSLKKTAQKFTKPKFNVFEGKDELQSALKDMLLYYNIETQAFWPQKKMVEILTPDFFRYHNKERIKNNLFTKAIWPEAQTVDIKKHPYFGVGIEFQREIRIAPKEIDFTMGYWIYGNKVVFVSSTQESFGFTVDSAEFSQMMKIQFEVIWNSSTNLKIKPEDTKSFLQELKLPQYK